jgi:hypothetical protein
MWLHEQYARKKHIEISSFVRIFSKQPKTIMQLSISNKIIVIGIPINSQLIAIGVTKKKKPAQRKPTTKNHYNVYLEFVLSIQAKLKRHRIGALLILLLPILIYVVSNLPWLNVWESVYQRFWYHNVNIDHSKIEKKNILATRFDYNQLFSAPNQFYFDSSERLGRNEMIDNLVYSNDSLRVAISPSTWVCGENFVLENYIYGQDTVHKILPEYILDADTTFVPLKEMLNNDGWMRGSVTDFSYSRCNIGTDSTDSDAELFKLQNPTLNLAIVNRSKNEIMTIDYIEAIVKKSAKNTYPYLYFHKGAGYDIPLFNEGWGDAHDIELKFNILSTREPVTYPSSYRHLLKIPKLRPWNLVKHYLNEEIKIDLSQAFAKEGVDTAYLNRHGSEFDDNSFKQLNKHVGKFKNGEARVVGVAVFKGKNLDGKIYTDSIKFNFQQYLIFPSIGGSEYNEFRSVHNFKLKSQGENYPTSRNIEENIPPNAAATIPLVFYSDLPAYHFFDLKIVYNGDKQFIIKNIFLNNYLPHSDNQFYLSKLQNIKKTKTHHLSSLSLP